MFANKKVFFEIGLWVQSSTTLFKRSVLFFFTIYFLDLFMISFPRHHTQVPYNFYIFGKSFFLALHFNIGMDSVIHVKFFFSIFFSLSLLICIKINISRGGKIDTFCVCMYSDLNCEIVWLNWCWLFNVQQKLYLIRLDMSSYYIYFKNLARLWIFASMCKTFLLVNVCMVFVFAYVRVCSDTHML